MKTAPIQKVIDLILWIGSWTRSLSSASASACRQSGGHLERGGHLDVAVGAGARLLVGRGPVWRRRWGREPAGTAARGGCPWDEDVYGAAAGGGHLQELQTELHNYGPWDDNNVG